MTDANSENTTAEPGRRRALIRGAGALAGAAVLGAHAAAAQQAAASATQAPAGQQPAGSKGPTAETQLPAGAPGAEARLAGKVAVVTGAARGIGRAIAVEFAANGADVVAIDIAGPVTPITRYPYATQADLDETGRLVRQHERRFQAIVIDTRDYEALRRAAETAAREMGGIDIVVANAGIQAFKPLLEMQAADWHDVIDVNLNGTSHTIRAFAPYLVQRGGGRIIATSSGQGRHGTKNASAYSASKWGIIGLVKSAAMELGKHKITVNSIEPGLIDTPMTRNETRWREAIGESNPNPPENPTEQQVVQARLPHSPLQVPWLTPDQVAPVAVFLASDAAAMVTGACYDVNAGDSALFTA